MGSIFVGSSTHCETRAAYLLPTRRIGSANRNLNLSPHLHARGRYRNSKLNRKRRKSNGRRTDDQSKNNLHRTPEVQSANGSCATASHDAGQDGAYCPNPASRKQETVQL